VRRWLGERLSDVGGALRDSGGNPLFLLELARDASTGPPRVGRSLDTLIDDRLRALDDASRDLLGWAAALGGEFDAERLAAATSLPVAEVLGRIAPFERRGLLRAAGDGGFDFVHGLVRQAVYRTLSTARRRALHQQIARAFAAASTEDPWLHGAVVHHASLAGDAPLAARAALAAGEHWLRVFANVEAAQVAERGLALLDDIATGVERARLEIGLLRLRVAAAATPGGYRQPALAERIRRAIAAAQAHGLHVEAAAGWEILAFWHHQQSDAAGAHVASLAAAHATRRADATTRCQQLATTGRCLLEIETDDDRARALLHEAEGLAAELQLPVMEIEWGRGLVARADGDLPAALAALERAVALARAAANHWREYECMLALATVEYELERADDVLRHVDEVADAARRMGESQVPFADALAALSRLRRGDPGAHAAVDAALAALRERDDKARLAYALNEAARFALAAGDAAAAARHAGEALAAATAVRRPTQIARAQALIAACAPRSRSRRPA
jgi:predicted ATPase